MSPMVSIADMTRIKHFCIFSRAMPFACENILLITRGRNGARFAPCHKPTLLPAIFWQTLTVYSPGYGEKYFQAKEIADCILGIIILHLQLKLKYQTSCNLTKWRACIIFSLCFRISFLQSILFFNLFLKGGET